MGRKTRPQKLPSINLLTNKHKRKTFPKITTSQSPLKRKLLFYLFETKMQFFLSAVSFLCETKFANKTIQKCANSRQKYRINKS